MPISRISTDYSNRKRDIHILTGVNPLKLGSSNVVPAFGSLSTYCAGVQKLIQRYVITFFTTIGSQNDFPDFGSNFMQKMISARRNMSKEEINHIFNFANAKIVSEFKNYQSEHPDLPLDEQISRATLISASALGDTLNLKIKITTLAGEAVEFLLPLPDTL